MEKKQKPKAAASECFCVGAGPHITEMFRRWGSDQAQEHFRNSRVEFLKGLRSLIDERIDSLSRKEAKGTQVPVE